jgi:predicted metalloendopeptidase
VSVWFGSVGCDLYMVLTHCVCYRGVEVYREWQKLGKRRNKQEWLMAPSQVNAYYNPPGNEVCNSKLILKDNIG